MAPPPMLFAPTTQSPGAALPSLSGLCCACACACAASVPVPVPALVVSGLLLALPRFPPRENERREKDELSRVRLKPIPPAATGGPGPGPGPGLGLGPRLSDELRPGEAGGGVSSFGFSGGGGGGGVVGASVSFSIGSCGFLKFLGARDAHGGEVVGSHDREIWLYYY